ncbi:MAG: vitamin B12 dependent methionine synthase [Limnochordia bacterium]
MVTVLDEIPFVPDAADLLEMLGIDTSSDLACEIRAVVVRAASVVKPKALYGVGYVEERGRDTVTIDGVVFTSRVLSMNLTDVYRVFPFIATCGLELDDLLADYSDELLRYSIDCLKSQALNAARRHLIAHVKSKYGIAGLSSMHPGSGDVDVWPIEQQVELFRLLGDAPARIGVQLSETCLMQPNKTVSGIFFPSEKDFYTCRLCRRDKCPGRRAMFDPMLWRKAREEDLEANG